jgi:hypothetical protein
MEDRRLFLNAYGYPCREGRTGPFDMRDPLAAIAMVGAFGRLGYRYAGSILNPPAKVVKTTSFEEVERFARTKAARHTRQYRPPVPLRSVDVSFLRATDLVLQVTRPPLSDDQIRGKKIVPRSYTTFEELILFKGPLQKWFRTLSRKEVVLTETAAKISDATRQYATQEYVQYKGSMFDKLRSLSGEEWGDRSDAKTAAFLVYEPHLWPGGPAFCCCFGLSADDTQAWCQQLANRLSKLLLAYTFVMAEMSTVPWPAVPHTTDFADQRTVEILGKKRLPSQPRNPSGIGTRRGAASAGRARRPRFATG